MAGELYLPHPHNTPDLTNVWAIMRDHNGKAVITSSGAVESYTTANIANYDIACTEQGTSSAVYAGDVPAGLVAGRYNVFFYQGTVTEAGAGAAVLIGVQEYEEPFYMVDGACNLDDTDLEDIYTVTWLKNGVPISTGGAITSPTIQVFDTAGTDLIASTAMTEIGTSESYRYSAVNAERASAGKVYRVKCTATIDGATRTSGFWINRDRTDA